MKEIKTDQTNIKKEYHIGIWRVTTDKLTTCINEAMERAKINF